VIRAPVALLVLALAGCQAGDGDAPRQQSSEDGISYATLAGWSVRRDRDTVILSGSPKKEQSRCNIALRTVPITGWSEPREPDNVLPSVANVLAALPGAEVSAPTEVDHPRYRAVAFDVTFTPRSRKGEKYRRRHVVLFLDHKITHALLTAPKGQLEAALPEFEQVVRSIQEEG
jgi:hypothetical protein